MTDESLRAAFRDRYGSVARVSRAPGRVNLIGEHTDYNDGYVLPVAIDLSTRVAFGDSAGTGLTVCSKAFGGEEVEIALGSLGPKRGHWSDYVCGVLRALEASGVEVPPAALLVESDVPLGSGLSSSASLEVATLGALLALADRKRTRPQIARLCQEAENEFVGTRCGIMDPFISSAARPGRALLLDCRTLEPSYVEVPAGVDIVIVSSGVRHSLADGEYNRRRAACESVVSTLADPRIRALRDLTMDDLEAARGRLGGAEYRRARHVVTENERVLAFVAALRGGDLASLGGLMAESHRSLRDDFEVSCAELDCLVEIAGRQTSLVGARMTGGGFGGCTVNLVAAGQGQVFQRAVVAGYREQTGRSAESWLTRPAAGASVY